MIHVVASCSDRKKDAKSAVALRTFRQKALLERCRAWWSEMRRTPKGVTRRAAGELYLGDHWATVREMSKDPLVRCWVASAGVGLVSQSAQLRSYAATFRANHRDSVCRDGGGAEARKENRMWWHLLSKRVGPEAEAPRAVAGISATHPRSTICVVGSPEYISALRDDLLEAREALSNPDRLVIVSSAPPSDCDELEDNWVVTNARLQSVVNGSRIGLNARVLKKILNERDRYKLWASVLQERYRRLIAHQPELVVYDRTPMTDVEVRKFIRSALRRDPERSRTALLRDLRRGGRQCEQGRFKQLFEEVRN